jgi:hypothetical protein
MELAVSLYTSLYLDSWDDFSGFDVEVYTRHDCGRLYTASLLASSGLNLPFLHLLCLSVAHASPGRKPPLHLDVEVLFLATASGG